MNSLLFAIAFALPTIGADAASKAIQEELKKLEGRWAFVLPEGQEGNTFHLEFAGKDWTLVFSEKNKVRGKLTIHPGTKPACIDFVLENGTFVEAIYKIEREVLTIRIGEANVKQRPTEFPSGDEPKEKTLAFKKVKPT